MIPEYLFRGDADIHNKRKLRSTIQNHLLQTNLTQGGNGQLIFIEPLWELVSNHVEPGWATTHFLSFSENREKAVEYALHDIDKTIEYFDYDGPLNSMDYVIVEFCRSNLKTLQKTNQQGIFKATFTPIAYAIRPLHEILLIDVRVFLKSQIHKGITGLDVAIDKAQRDVEWLLLPTTPIKLNFDRVEYTGILDGGCITQFSKYSKTDQSAFGSFFG